MADDGNDPNIAVTAPAILYLRWSGKILGFVFRPIITAVHYLVTYLIFSVLFLLNIIYQPLAFLLQPVVHLLGFVLSLFLAPFRALAKLETLYIYLGVAALVGIIGGLLLNYLYGTLYKVLRLEAAPKRQEQPQRTAKQYREEKRKAKANGLDPPAKTSGSQSSGTVSNSDSPRRTRRQRSLLAQTILEEDDSDF